MKLIENNDIEEVAKEYTDKLIEYEEMLVLSKELLKKTNVISNELKILEKKLRENGVEIKDV